MHASLMYGMIKELSVHKTRTIYNPLIILEIYDLEKVGCIVLKLKIAKASLRSTEEKWLI